MDATTRDYIANLTTVAMVNESIDIISNNAQCNIAATGVEAHNEMLAALLNRKWELNGTRGYVFISQAGNASVVFTLMLMVVALVIAVLVGMTVTTALGEVQGVFDGTFTCQPGSVYTVAECK